jgi:hypothetical protein
MTLPKTFDLALRRFYIGNRCSSFPIYHKLFNALKPKLVQIMFMNAVRTSKRTPHFTITKINWLTLFKEITAVYSENDTKPKLV